MGILFLGEGTDCPLLEFMAAYCISKQWLHYLITDSVEFESRF